MKVKCWVRVLFSSLGVLFIALAVFLAYFFTNVSALKSQTNISALQSNYPKTVFRNDQELLEKINKIKREGLDHLQIVTDFDQTLTADPGENGKEVLNSYEMLRLCPSIPKSYKEEDTKLYLKYKPIEQNPDLSVDEKSKFLTQWYKESQNLLKGIKFPRTELDSIAQNVSNSFRDGVDVLLNWSEVHNVPVLVLSSGLGDAVVASLKAANLLASNVKVISNFLEIDKDDIIIGSQGNPIHSYNKNQASIKNTDYYAKIMDRDNVLLLGDSIGDANMTDGMEHRDIVIKVGFLSKKKTNELEIYLKHFDIVIKDDQTMDIVNSLISLFET